VTVAGLVRCWGSNYSGQTNVPSNLGAVTQVSSGGAHVCAVTVAQDVQCWGYNGFGQTDVPLDLGQVTQVSTGDTHSCAVTVAGLVRCWGNNNYGQTNLPSDLGAVTQVSAGDTHSCAVTVAGLVRCWGLDELFSPAPSDLGLVIQLSSGDRRSCAVTVAGLVRCWGGTDAPLDLGEVTQVSAGDSHSCAVTVAGLVRCWGYNRDGQTDVPSDLYDVTQVSARGTHSCAMTVAGLVRCWGNNRDGQTDAPSQLGEVTQVAGASFHTCAVSPSRVVHCWGFNGYGQTDVPLDLGAAIQVGGNNYHTCAVTVAGLVRCWGANDEGSINVPLDLGAVTQIAVAAYHTCAVTVAGLVRCWGSNYYGQTNVPSNLGAVTQVSADFGHTCAVTVAGLVRCWGSNYYGQTNVPSNLGVVTQVSAGGTHTCAVSVAGLVRCWGDTREGQTNVPSDLGVVTQVSAGGSHTCAVSVAGLVRCWGYNSQGQTNVPSDLGVVTQVSAGLAHTCAVSVAGLVRCWGYNDSGQTNVPAAYSTISPLFKQPETLSVEAMEGTIIGDSSPGSVLRANNVLEAVQLLYLQWFRDGVAIEGETQPTYEVTTRDYGATLTATMLGRNNNSISYSVATRNVTFPPLELLQPTISGINSFGGSLTAAVDVMNPDVSYSYQWLRNGEEISTATSAQYSLQLIDLGQNLSVRVTGSKDRHLPATLTSQVSRISNSIPNSPCLGNIEGPSSWLGTTSQPAISGTPAFGQSLKGFNGVWVLGTKYCVFWTADGVVIPKTTTSTLKLDGTSVGKKVQFVVVGIDKSSKRVARVSEPLQVTRASFTSVKNPTVKGMAKVGVKLTSSLSSWGSGTSYGYQWLRNSGEISGATASSYVPTAADVGTNLSLRVCGTKPYFEQRCVESVSQVVSLGVISKVGLASVRGTSTNIGVTIFGNTTQWMPGVELSWQWLADGIEIEGANASTYTIARSDRGKTISLRITGYADGYQSVSKVAKYKKIP